MSLDDADGQQSLVVAVVLGTAGLVVSGTIAVAMYAGGDRARVDPAVVLARPHLAAPSATALSALDAAQALADEASVQVEYGVVKFYFASGRADLAFGAGEALDDLARRLTPGHSLAISGFHDASGDAEKNAGLANMRALAIRNALRKAGVKTEQMKIEKPQQMTADSSSAEARRVEVKLQ